MGEGRYLYGVIKANDKKSYGSCGINSGDEVYTINYQDIACVVSNSSRNDYTSMLKEDLGHLLVEHQSTIEKVMKEDSIIPTKFGTNVSDDEEVIEVLKRGYPQLIELFSTMDGKIELDVAAIWNDLNGFIREIGEEDKEIRDFKEEIAKRPPSQSLQDRIKIGMMIKDSLDRRREKEQAHIIDTLKELTIDFQKHQVMDDKMILNCAFLLEKSREPDFDAGLKELDKEYEQKVNFRCVGPLPPYSFATCQLKRVGYKEIDEAKRLLGLANKVSLEAVKEAYRELAQEKHPDRDPNNAQLEEKFEKVTHAYKLLTSCCQAGDVFLEDSKRKDFILVEIIRP